MTHSPTTDAACRLLQHDTAYEHTRKPQSPVRLPARCSSWPEGLLAHLHSPVSRLVENREDPKVFPADRSPRPASRRL